MSARPAAAVHPSAIILREIEARGWTRHDLACCLVAAFPGNYRNGVDVDGKPYLGLGVARLSIDMYLDVGPKEYGLRLGDTAGELDRVFGVADGFFARLESAWLATFS